MYAENCCLYQSAEDQFSANMQRTSDAIHKRLQMVVLCTIGHKTSGSWSIFMKTVFLYVWLL